MMFKTHLAFAVFLGILLIYYLRPDAPVLFSLIFLFSAVLPDIDTNKSKIGRRLRPFSDVANLLFGHRGFLHTLWVPIALFVMLYYVNQPFLGFAVFSGYTLHLLCDALSLRGVKLFAPLWKFNFHGFVRTGGLMEQFVLLAVCISIGLFIIRIACLA